MSNDELAEILCALNGAVPTEPNGIAGEINSAHEALALASTSAPAAATNSVALHAPYGYNGGSSAPRSEASTPDALDASWSDWDQDNDAVDQLIEQKMAVDFEKEHNREEFQDECFKLCQESMQRAIARNRNFSNPFLPVDPSSKQNVAANNSTGRRSTATPDVPNVDNVSDTQSVAVSPGNLVRKPGIKKCDVNQKLIEENERLKAENQALLAAHPEIGASKKRTMNMEWYKDKKWVKIDEDDRVELEEFRKLKDQRYLEEDWKTEKDFANARRGIDKEMKKLMKRSRKLDESAKQRAPVQNHRAQDRARRTEDISWKANLERIAAEGAALARFGEQNERARGDVESEERRSRRGERTRDEVAEQVEEMRDEPVGEDTNVRGNIESEGNLLAELRRQLKRLSHMPLLITLSETGDAIKALRQLFKDLNPKLKRIYHANVDLVAQLIKDLNGCEMTEKVKESIEKALEEIKDVHVDQEVKPVQYGAPKRKMEEEAETATKRRKEDDKSKKSGGGKKKNN